jgi:hypothetical protein
MPSGRWVGQELLILALERLQLWRVRRLRRSRPDREDSFGMGGMAGGVSIVLEGDRRVREGVLLGAYRLEKYRLS